MTTAKRFSAGVLIGFLLATLFSAPWVYQAWAVGSCSVFRSWNTGDTVTAGDLNSSFTTAAVTNSTPQCLDDYSATVSQMQTTTDPYASGTESLATSTAGELERLRFMFKQIFGLTNWYRHDQAPTFSFSHINASALHLSSIGVAGGTDTAQNQFLSRFPVLTGPNHWTGIWWPHNTTHMAISIADYNHAQGGVQGGIELFRFHAVGIVFHHTVALMFKHSESQMHGGQRGHVTAIQIDPSTDQLIFGHHVTGMRLRAAGLHVGGLVQVGFGGHVAGTLTAGTAEVKFVSASSITLTHGIVPIFTNGTWSMRTIRDAVTLSNSGLSSNTLYYIYLADNSNSLTLEASTTGHETDLAFGVEVKSGDRTRTLVGMVYIVGGNFVDHASGRLTATWFGRRVREAHATATTSIGMTTTSVDYVSFSSDTEVSVVTWGEELACLTGGGDVANSSAGGFVFFACTVDGFELPGSGGGTSAGAGSRFFFIAHGVQQGATEGFHRVFPKWRVNTGTGTLSGAAPESLTTRVRVLR